MAIHVSVGFDNIIGNGLLPLAANAVTGLTGNAALSPPPERATGLDTRRQSFHVAQATASSARASARAARASADPPSRSRAAARVAAGQRSWSGP